MVAVRAVWLRIAPLVITPLVRLAVPALVAGGWLVRAVAALAPLAPPMPPPLGGLRPRPDAWLGLGSGLGSGLGLGLGIGFGLGLA